MAIGYAQSKMVYLNGTSTSCTFDSNVGANSIIVVSLHIYGNASNLTLTDTHSNTYNQIGTPVSGGDGSLYLAVYWALNTTPGALTVNLSALVTSTMNLVIHEFTGAQVSPVDVSNSATGTGTTVNSGSVTTTYAPDLLFAAMTSMAGGAVTITPDATFTQMQENENGAAQMHTNTMYKVVGSTGVNSGTWTIGSSLGWIGRILALKESAAPIGGTASVTLDGLTSSASGVVESRNFQAYWNTSLSANQEAYFTAPVAACPTRLWMRMANPTGMGTNLSGYFIECSGTNIDVHRYNDVGSVNVVLASFNYVLKSGDSLWATINGSTIKVYVKFVGSPVYQPIISVTDGSPLNNAGYVGIETLDVGTRIDDFGAGELASTGFNGSLSATLGTLTASSTGTVSVSGTTSQTLGALTGTLTGTVSLSGSGSNTLGTLTSSATGTVEVKGSTGQTLATLTASGTGVLPINGTGTNTLGALASSATGVLPINGTGNNTLGALTVSASGFSEDKGSLTATLGALTVSASGTVAASGSVVGTLSATLAEMTETASGTVLTHGTGSNTLDALTSTANGKVDVKGSGSNTLGTLVLFASSSAQALGTLSATLDALTGSASGAVVVSGATNATLATLSNSATGTVTISGTGSNTLSGLSSNLTGAVEVKGSGNNTLGTLTLFASSSAQSNGVVNATLAALTSNASGVVPISGSANNTLAILSESSTGAVRIFGTTSGTLGELTASANGTVPVLGSIASTLAALTGSGSGMVTTNVVTLGRGDITLGLLIAVASGSLATQRIKPKPRTVDSVTFEPDFTYGYGGPRIISKSVKGGNIIRKRPRR